MSLGINIKRRRLELRMSQQELAQAMGYKTRSTIAKIESGENDVSQKKLQKFAAVLDTTVEALLSGQISAPLSQSATVDFPLSNGSRNIVVILAGGTTMDKNRNIPLQFVNISGKPILVYSMDAYQAHPSIDDIYIVCLKGWEQIVKAYAHQYGITKLKGLIPAGSSGVSSLKNALDYIKKHYSADDLIIVQEATRPLVSVETISNVLLAGYEKGTATTCYSMKEYVQFFLSENNAKYIDRNSVIAPQSPEAHRLSLLLNLFDVAEKRRHPLTESCCTMLFFNLGFPINFIENNINNIKISREEDIAAFQALI